VDNPAASRAGTVHLNSDLDGLTNVGSALATGHVPDHSFMLLGQMTHRRSLRSPTGTESAWTYTHIPRETVKCSELTGHIGYGSAPLIPAGTGSEAVSRLLRDSMPIMWCLANPKPGCPWPPASGTTGPPAPPANDH
jgi:hypothetical protein